MSLQQYAQHGERASLEVSLVKKQAECFGKRDANQGNTPPAAIHELLSRQVSDRERRDTRRSASHQLCSGPFSFLPNVELYRRGGVRSGLVPSCRRIKKLIGPDGPMIDRLAVGGIHGAQHEYAHGRLCMTVAVMALGMLNHPRCQFKESRLARKRLLAIVVVYECVCAASSHIRREANDEQVRLVAGFCWNQAPGAPFGILSSEFCDRAGQPPYEFGVYWE